MDRSYVSSSNVLSIGYHEPAETLEVEFLNGYIYQYYNVPMALYQQFMQAGSKGKFLNEYIKNFYPYSRV